MRQIARCTLIAAALCACGPAPAPTAAAPAPSLPPLAVPAAPLRDQRAQPPATPDDPERYRPPLPAAEGALELPRVVTVELAGGLRALVVERPDARVVELTVVLRREGLAGRLGGALPELLLEAIPRSPPRPAASPLREQLEALGVELWTLATRDAGFLGLTLAPEALEEALAAILRALEDPAVPAPALERVRERRLAALAAEPPLVRLQRRIDESLFPAGHPYRELASGEEAALRRLQPADLTRPREPLLRPADVAICAAGDVSAPGLRAALERHAGAWRPPEPARPARRAPPELARGVFLIEEPAASDVAVAVVLPGPLRGAEDESVAALTWSIFIDSFWGSMRQALPGRVEQMRAFRQPTRDQDLFEVGSPLPPAEAATFVRATVELIEAAERWTLVDAGLDRLRQEQARELAETLDGSRELVQTLAAYTAIGVPLERRWAQRSSALLAPAPDITRFLRTYFRKDAVRVVAIGDVAAARPALEALGLGPIVSRRVEAPPARPSGAKDGPRRSRETGR